MARDKGLLSDLQIRHGIRAGTTLHRCQTRRAPLIETNSVFGQPEPPLSLGLGVSLGNVGMVLFVQGAATYLAAACAMRAVARSRRAFAVDRAIDLEAWRINQQRLTLH